MIFSESLKKNKDFQVVYRKGKSYANKYLVMYVLKNEEEKNSTSVEIDLVANQYTLNSEADEMFEIKYPERDIRIKVMQR